MILLPFNELAGVLDINLEEFFLIMKAKMVQDIIFLLVQIDPGIELRMILQKILHLQDIGGGKNEFGNLLFVHFFFYHLVIINLLLLNTQTIYIISPPSRQLKINDKETPQNTSFCNADKLKVPLIFLACGSTQINSLLS